MFGQLLRALGKPFAFPAALLTSDVIDETPIGSLAGDGFCTLQLRRRRNGGGFISLKTKGGDATIWVGLGRTDTEALIEALSSYASRLIEGKDDRI